MNITIIQEAKKLKKISAKEQSYDNTFKHLRKTFLKNNKKMPEVINLVDALSNDHNYISQT